MKLAAAERITISDLLRLPPILIALHTVAAVGGAESSAQVAGSSVTARTLPRSRWFLMWN